MSNYETQRQHAQALTTHFLKCWFSDTVLRVRVLNPPASMLPPQAPPLKPAPEPPSSKRKRGSGKKEIAQPLARSTATVDICCHSLILSSCSNKLRESLIVAQGPRPPIVVELEVQNEQELEDLRLCVKPCYGATFTHDEGRKLVKATRTRLALLAARHDIQIESCDDECI